MLLWTRTHCPLYGDLQRQLLFIPPTTRSNSASVCCSERFQPMTTYLVPQKLLPVVYQLQEVYLTNVVRSA